jgi:hypothetical protein
MAASEKGSEDEEQDEVELPAEELDPMTEGVEHALKVLSKSGGSSRFQKDVETEMRDLNLHVEEGCFKGLSITELEAGQAVCFGTDISEPVLTFCAASPPWRAQKANLRKDELCRRSRQH